MQTRCRQRVDEHCERTVRAPIDHQHDFERTAKLAVEFLKRRKQFGDRRLVPEDRNYEGVAGRHELQAAATAAISSFVSSG